MLNGIGGRTIAQAKANLSYNEYLIWIEFRKQRGSLFTGRRVEQAVGPLTHITAIAAGAKSVKPEAFLPHEPKPEPKEEDAMEAFKRFAGVN